MSSPGRSLPDTLFGGTTVLHQPARGQGDLSALAATKLAANGSQERGRSLPADVTDTSALEQGLADLVVCNPPYVAPGRGRSPRVAAGARVGELASFTVAARRVVGPRGRVALVCPAQELATLFTELRNAGLEPKRLRFVHATRDEPARVSIAPAAVRRDQEAGCVGVGTGAHAAPPPAKRFHGELRRVVVDADVHPSSAPCDTETAPKEARGAPNGARMAPMASPMAPIETPKAPIVQRMAATL